MHAVVPYFHRCLEVGLDVSGLREERAFERNVVELLDLFEIVIQNALQADLEAVLAEGRVDQNVRQPSRSDLGRIQRSWPNAALFPYVLSPASEFLSER